MENTGSERVVLRVPTDFTAEELAQLCHIKPDSAAFDVIEEMLPDIQEYGRPAAIIKWASVDAIEGDLTTIEGVTFRSKVVADKLKDTPRVFLSAVTAGSGLEESGLFEGEPFLDTFNSALFFHSSRYTIKYMKEKFGFDGSSMLNPGSLPDWPIQNNFALFDMIGNVGEIGMSLNEAGYIKPWNSSSSIHFSGDGYQNCSLCKKRKCPGRRAKFNREEYIRIFGVDPEVTPEEL